MSYACSCARSFVSMSEQVLCELTHEGGGSGGSSEARDDAKESARLVTGGFPDLADPASAPSSFRVARWSPSSPLFLAAPAATQGERRRVRVVL